MRHAECPLVGLIEQPGADGAGHDGFLGADADNLAAPFALRVC
ncbi:MAG: hypothetical protein JWL84_5882 [Rhodospirillales bacterium]|nr:hypothetical protein [Rhodospirillales bacterium]